MEEDMRKNVSGRLARRLLMGVFLIGILMLVGCGPLKIHSNPETFKPNYQPLPVFKSKQQIRLENAYLSEEVVDVTADGPNWIGDLKQFTDTAIVILTEEFAKSNIHDAPTAETGMTLRIYNVNFVMGAWMVRCTLWLEMVMPDGKIVDVQGINSSPGGAFRAVDGAIIHAVENLLQDKRLVEYLYGGSL
jgi:hypothetical protein